MIQQLALNSGAKIRFFSDTECFFLIMSLNDIGNQRDIRFGSFMEAFVPCFLGN